MKHLELLLENAACAGKEDLFTLEARDLRAGTRRQLRAICAACPVAAICHEYAQAIKPTCGMFAGVVYTIAQPGGVARN